MIINAQGGKQARLVQQDLQVLLEQSPSYYRTLTHKLHWAGSLTAIEPSHN